MSLAFEMNDSFFTTYLGALAVSGIILLVLALSGFGGQSGGARALSGLIGAAMLGYAFYLFFIFDGGTVFVAWYVFVVPVLLIINAVKGAMSRRQQSDEPLPAESGQGGTQA